MDPTAIILAIIVAIIAILIVFRVIVLPEYEQVIIYRLGRFRRLGGPGLVTYNRFLDTLERRIDTRDKKQSIPINGLFVYDIPFGFRLDIWMRYAPGEIAAGDHAVLTQLSHIAENEQMGNVRTEIKRALQQSLAQIQNRYPLPSNPGIIDKLLPIIPGTSICNELLDLMTEKLAELLPKVGFVLSPNREFTIFDIILGQEIIDIFNRGRLAKSLRDDIPTINDERIYEFLGKVRGLDIDIKHVIVENPDGAEVRIRDEDRDVEVRHSRMHRRPSPLGPPPWENNATGSSENQTSNTTQAETAKPPSANEADTHSSQPNRGTDETNREKTPQPAGIPFTMPVSDDDWRVMKVVPRLSNRP